MGRGVRTRRRLCGALATATALGAATALVLVGGGAREEGRAEPGRGALAMLPAGPRGGEADRPPTALREARRPAIRWRRSRSLGTHSDGRLRDGVLLPAGGRWWVSWDPIERRRPDRAWRRWGSDRLLRATISVLLEFHRAHRGARRVVVGDLSRPRGGDFGPRFGGIGHASHQNGLDIDVYYPRRDRRLRPARLPGQVDRPLAQDLVDRFVAAGAEKVFVGPSLELDGVSDVVVPLVHHDDHLHFRLPLQ